MPCVGIAWRVWHPRGGDVPGGRVIRRRCKVPHLERKKGRKKGRRHGRKNGRQRSRTEGRMTGR